MKPKLLAAAAILAACAGAAEPRAAEEVCARDGAGRFLAKLQAGRAVRVAYLGGSITEMNGWRNMTTGWLRAAYPNAKVEEIAASIGGTGSDLGVFRLGHDALAHKPDLLFVEFATNDHERPEREVVRTMEGIVRQTWRADPETDIVFVYTITQPMTGDYLAGRCTRTASVMERVADHYGIPSVNFGPRVAAELAAGRLAIAPNEATGDKAGVPVFAPDGVHPHPVGHGFYLQSVTNAFARMAGARPADHAARLAAPPLAPDNLENAKMVSLEPSMLQGAWRRLGEDDDKYRWFSGRAGDMWYTWDPGARIRFAFKGTCCKIYDLLGPDGGQVFVTVDGKTSSPRPRFDSYCTYWRLATLDVYDGPDGVHEVEITVDEKQPDRSPVAVRLKDPEKELKSPKFDGTGFWPAKIMLAGDLAPLAPARPKPRPALARRLAAEDTEVYGIIHWGPNTYTDREWGFGDEDPANVAPEAFDADQIASACAAGGMKGLVVVCKHHDGFCMWPTKTTEHNISRSPFRGGKGDYVREMADACRRAGMKFGVYVSPWDRNSAVYATDAYVKLYHEQIRELLCGDYGEVFEMWFDGANGGDGYYGGAREKRTIGRDYYRFPELLPRLRRLQPQVCFFNESDGADFRWPGNEQGILDPDSRATVRPHDPGNYLSYCNVGDADGSTFHPCEADFPLRPGWFYHAKEDGRTKGPAYLMKTYLRTVGNGGTMNIGVAPNKRGVLTDEDVAALRGFGALQRAFFGKPLEKGPCNVIVMREDVTDGERVDGWELRRRGADAPLLSGKAIGIKRIRTLDAPVNVEDLELAVTKAAPGHRLYPTRFYRVDPELLKAVAEATAEGGETDTAKWMTAGSEGR